MSSQKLHTACVILNDVRNSYLLLKQFQLGGLTTASLRKAKHKLTDLVYDINS